jgi:hypothetical protein
MNNKRWNPATRHTVQGEPGNAEFVAAQVRDAVYCTTYCNHGHRLRDGMPVNHECYVLPPEALKLEREDKFEEAIAVIQKAKPLRVSRGVRR